MATWITLGAKRLNLDQVEYAELGRDSSGFPRALVRSANGTLLTFGGRDAEALRETLDCLDAANPVGGWSADDRYELVPGATPDGAHAACDASGDGYHHGDGRAD